MADLIDKQMQTSRFISRSLPNFKKIGKNNLTPATIRSRISSLKENWSLMLTGHAALTKTIPESSQHSIDYFADQILDSTEETYQTTLDFMLECLEELEPPVSPNQSLAVEHIRSTSNAFSLSHLPAITLPPFSGEYHDWEQFRDRFSALIIKNKELNDFARMHFLTSCLKGRALDSIANLAVTADNFNLAWSILTARFENKRRLLHLHLSTLLNLAAIQRESASELLSIRDKVKLAVHSLDKLDRTPAELWHDILVHIIVQKLDPSTRKAWTVRSSDDAQPPSFEEFSHFLDSRVRALEEFSATSSNKANIMYNSKVNVATASTQFSTSAFASAKTVPPCPICKAQHYFSACPSFVNGNPKHRHELATRYRRCFNCLSQNHFATDCNSKYTCRKCNKNHHTMLHEHSETATVSHVPPPLDRSSQSTNSPAAITTLVASPLSRSISQVLLATAWVTVGVSTGRRVVARALLDQGSEVSFISENLAQTLRAPRTKMPVSISAIGCVQAGVSRHATQIIISPRDSQTPSFTTNALILKNLTSYTPKRSAEFSSLPHLSKLHLADPNPTSSDPISILLGADVYNNILLNGLRKGRNDEPIAQNSIFGWVISGSFRSDKSRERLHVNTDIPTEHNTAVHHCLPTPSLDDVMKTFWEIEDVPPRTVQTIEDARCEEHFRSTHSRAEDGRYIVRLPFKTGPPIAIGDSRCQAENLLKSLSRRFQAHPKLAEEYKIFLDDYERLGHMRRTDPCFDSTEQCVYIPHHPVLRETSVTTRLRVVFNASSLTTNGSSLNEHLLAGPKLQPELSAIILRWRLFQYVYSADIAKMFRQILLDHRDINYQRILWKATPHCLPTEYQLLTVTYGMACAPYLALRVIQQLASDEGSRFPLASPILHDNIYVDDVLFGGDDLPSVRRTRDQLIELLRQGGFELHKWASNSSLLLTDIAGDNHGLACNKSLAMDESLKILGIEWNPAQDNFQFTISSFERVPKTKRSILSAISKLYDPLGWVTPAIITTKIFMQHLWQAKLSWDETISEPLLSRWSNICAKLSFLNKVQVPRWTGLRAHIAQFELHGFADASNVAYSAVAYLKVVSRSGDVTVTLLAGKSKVAPLTPLSIPRLELSAAVLLTRLLEFIRRSCRFENMPCVCWSDSMVVLAWLSQHPSRWKTFVAHRVADVQHRLPQAEWRYVPTEDNPADCASRGLLGDELLDHSLWWQGPSWLPRSRADWPATSARPSESTSLEEKIVTLHVSQPPDTSNLASRFSSWPTLIRVTAYIFRFISLCRRSRADPHGNQGRALSAAECSRAKTFWLKQIQAETFSSELSALLRGKHISAKSAILSLHPFIDSTGLIRVGGRLSRAQIPFTSRHPVLLASHPLVSLIIDQAHSRALHAGLQLTLSTLRSDYWILRARSLVKARIYRCVPCVRERAALPSQLMGDLPSVRVNAPPRSFHHCGIDYAGPVQVRASSGRGSKSRKAYIALFICLATRAVHLELVGDYSTSAFLNAFTRFCSRRGLPHSIYSDNGTNFIGADRELSIAYRSALRDPEFQNLTASDNVSWHFLPPSAPHFGGLWEAGVKSVKHHLRRVIGSLTLTIEEFTTLLCKVEACLNSRPLAPLSDSYEDYEPLTPGHFLIGSAITTSPEPSLLSLNENRLSRWQLVRQIAERFWRLWQSDYVNTLQQRNKWRVEKAPIKIGQIVLLKNSNLPPCKWEIGRVTLCHPGSDGLTRVVTVKTAHTTYKRPIVKLCILPVP